MNKGLIGALCLVGLGGAALTYDHHLVQEDPTRKMMYSTEMYFNVKEWLDR